MFFIVKIPPYVALLIFLGLAVLGALFFVRSRKSRTRYFCPNCNTSIQLELMKAKHCSICGAALIEARHDKNILGDYDKE